MASKRTHDEFLAARNYVIRHRREGALVHEW